MSVESPTHEGRNRRRLAMAAAAVVAVIGVTGIAVAVATSSGDDATQSPAAATTLAPTTSVAPVTEELPQQAPVEVCVREPRPRGSCRDRGAQPGLPAGGRHDDHVDRGDTWQLNVSDVSDPRLDGTWYNSADGDLYSLPGGAPGRIWPQRPTASRTTTGRGRDRSWSSGPRTIRVRACSTTCSTCWSARAPTRGSQRS